MTKAKNGNGILKKVAVKSPHSYTGSNLTSVGPKVLQAALLHVLHVCDRNQAAKMLT